MRDPERDFGSAVVEAEYCRAAIMNHGELQLFSETAIWIFKMEQILHNVPLNGVDTGA